MSVFLQVEDLSTWIDTDRGVVRAVDGLSFHLNAGETFALLGESGCGKSMTALSLMRLLPDAARVMSGRVLLQGQDLLALPESTMRRLRGHRMAMIFQEPGASLNPVLSVADQIVEVVTRHTALRGAAALKRCIELLEAVGIPDASRRAREYPFQLSGGMKQRVMIAGALACDPALLIADEPTTALDVTIQAQVLDLLRDIQRQRGMAMLLITHDLGVVAESAHRVAVMYAGEIVETATVDTFFARPAHPYARKLFDSLPRRGGREAPLAVIPGAVPSLAASFKGCRFADRCDRALPLCHDTPPAAVELAPDHVVRCHLYGDGRSADLGESAPVRSPSTESRTMPRTLLSVRDLRVHFPIRKGLLRRVTGHVHAVDGVDLDIPTHSTVALVGESGCGKTTVGKGLLRLLPLTAGEVRFQGVDLAALSPADMRRHRKNIQIVFQDPYSSLNPRLRVKEIIEEGMLALRVGGDAAERNRRIDRLLEQVGLSSEMRHRYPHEFSGGQRQRIAIARALSVEPRLIICDEPTSALDVSVQAQILNLLRDLQRQLGLSYLFITHNIAVVEYLAHEVAVMYLGRIVEKGSVDAVLRAPRHPYTRALLSAVPEIDPKARPERLKLSGEQPSPSQPPSGCHFHPRCVQAAEICRRTYPETVKLDANHQVNCHLYPAAPG